MSKPDDPVFVTSMSAGLTKREFFAALAMHSMGDSDMSCEQIAEVAVMQADELIAALLREGDQ